jgi:hypothetical protein
MALDTYAQQSDGSGDYLSTDPYAGMIGDQSFPTGTPSPWTGGITGQGTDPRAGAAAGSPATGATAGATAGPYSGDPTNVDTWLAWLAKQPGHDPILDTPQGQAYYKQRIGETGGLNASNTAYWQNKATLGSAGGAVGVPEGGGVGGGNLWNTLPTLEDLQNMPGYQAMLKAGTDAVQGSAAAKGTLLTGGTQKDITDYAQNQALQSYLGLSGLKLGYNQANFGNLYNLANLGLSGSATGAA